MLKKLGFIFLCLIIALSLWAFVIEPGFTHHLSTHSIKIKNWKRDNYKIVVLADLHIGAPFNGLSKLEEIVKMTNESQPDLILIAGDFVIHGVVGGSYIAPAQMAPYIKKLKAKDGVYAVLGNHDHWLDSKEVTEAIESVGVPVLTNKAVQKKGFWLLGIDDSWAGKPELKKTLSQINNDDPILLLTHNPDFFVHIPERISLTIAGHTHGGQVYIPFWGRPIVPSKFGERFAIGKIQEGNKMMFVNPGTGTSILPVRFLVPPEVSLLNISSY